MAELAILACGVTPILLFCGCLPFLVLCCFFGSHLSRETTNFAEPYSLRIEDFFLAMTVVAGLLAIAFPAFAFVTEDNGGELTTGVINCRSIYSGVHFCRRTGMPTLL